MPTKSNRVTPEQAEHNADRIVSFWRWGLDSLGHCAPDDLVYGKATRRQRLELARLKGRQRNETAPLDVVLNIDTLGKMRRVAADYGEKQIESLADQVRRHRSRFSTSHLIRSLAVADRTTRDAIVAQAVRQSWSLSSFDRRVQVARGARRAGAGRKPDVPTDRDQRLVVLEGLCLRWLRWTELAASELPSDLRKLVRAADATVAAISVGLGTHLPRAEGGEGGHAKSEGSVASKSASRRVR